MVLRMHTTPPTLLERLRQPGADDAWARFVELYTPLLYAWARRVGLCGQDAEDLVQDVMTTLVQKLPEFTYDPQKSFRAWLRTILLNKWRNRRRQPPAAPLGGEGGTLLDATDSLAELEDAEYRQYLVGRALSLIKSEFPDDIWKIYQEYVIGDRSAADVAREHGITVNAVYLTKSRVLARLRHELAGLMD